MCSAYRIVTEIFLAARGDWLSSASRANYCVFENPASCSWSYGRGDELPGNNIVSRSASVQGHCEKDRDPVLGKYECGELFGRSLVGE